MAESGLSIGYTEISVDVADFLGYGITSANWSTRATQDINRALDDGVRRFLLAVDPRSMKQYGWSFLKPTATLTTVAPYSTGTIAITDGGTTVTLSDGTWPSWAANGTLEYSGVEYDVSSRTSDTEIELISAWSTTITGASYELKRLYYDLPDDFGSLAGSFSYPMEEGRETLRTVGIGDILRMTAKIEYEGDPNFICVKPKTFDGTGGQRWEVRFYPLPSEAWAFSYQYNLLLAYQMDSTTTFPVGGMAHVQTFKEACLASAEISRDDVAGLHNQLFERCLIQSIEYDRRLSPSFIGKMREDSQRVNFPAAIYYATVNGSVPT